MTENGQSGGVRVSNKTHFWGVVTLMVVVLGLIADTTKADNDNFYTDIIRLDNVATRIHQSYVEEVSSEDLVDHAITGMLEILDPHTSFFKKKDYEELKIHTEGKFGGLGIQISIRDKILTVMTPISGTPASRAGIQSGDQIIEIEGKSTKGITIDAAVAKLRGEPGSEVTIKIRRKGEAKPLDFTIVREIITIKSVPYSGILKDGIGYVRLLTFSQEAGEEVEKAIKRLLKNNIKGLILDLRHNPGGLLPEAKEVSEKFLARKSLIVSTRGRLRAQNKEYYAGGNPVLPTDIPLVVLVNAASASASEIVAGAIQDWDRGVVLGDTTFGKGSVQSILPLDKEHHLKLTTAFYYTPSGRCINKPENDIPDTENGDENDEMESEKNTTKPEEDESGSQSKRDTVEYKTNKGRIVFGGGGIIPDTIVEFTQPDPIIKTLFLKDVFFKFANSEYPRLIERKIVVDSSLVIDKKIMNDFQAFLDSIQFEYKSLSHIKLDEFKSWAGLEKDTTVDSALLAENRPDWKDEEVEELNMMVAKIESLIKKEDQRDFEKSEDLIKRYIYEALLVRGLGQDNNLVYRTKLRNDDQVLAAVGILMDEQHYKRLLEPAKNKKNKQKL